MLTVEASAPLVKHERVVGPDGSPIRESTAQLDAGRPAGKESYLSFGKTGTVRNDGNVWTISFPEGGPGLSLSYVFPS